MQTEIDRFPYGEIEGAPVMAIRSNSKPTPDALALEVARNRRPGLAAVWLKSAQWGTPEWDRALLNLIADPSRGRMHVVAMRDIEADDWSSLDIYWLGDLSTFLAERVLARDISERLGRLKYFPVLQELIVRRPPVANLSPAILDEVFSHLDPRGTATIYAPPDDSEYMECALNAITRCATPWMLRVDHETTDEKKEARCPAGPT